MPDEPLSLNNLTKPLDGLLANDTVLRPKTHYTDTHGFTEQLFGLCYLLGFQFLPRINPTTSL